MCDSNVSRLIAPDKERFEEMQRIPLPGFRIAIRGCISAQRTPRFINDRNRHLPPLTQNILIHTGIPD
jgi:hypothetical protein